jgi:hypothetical protein
MCSFWAGGISSFQFSRAREYRLLRRLEKIMPFVLDSALSISLVKILSISVAVCCVILVGLNISGIYDDVNKTSKNQLV